MKTSFNGLLSLIGAILVFTTVSVCFSNCSSEDDFGEMEEIFATMAQKKMTRAGIEGGGNDHYSYTGTPVAGGSESVTFNLSIFDIYYSLSWSRGFANGTTNPSSVCIESFFLLSTDEYAYIKIDNKFHYCKLVYNVCGTPSARWVEGPAVRLDTRYYLDTIKIENDVETLIDKDNKNNIQNDSREIYVNYTEDQSLIDELERY